MLRGEKVALKIEVLPRTYELLNKKCSRPLSLTDTFTAQKLERPRIGHSCLRLLSQLRENGEAAISKFDVEEAGRSQ
jgi:hypothetical protein